MFHYASAIGLSLLFAPVCSLSFSHSSMSCFLTVTNKYIWNSIFFPFSQTFFSSIFCLKKWNFPRCLRLFHHMLSLYIQSWFENCSLYLWCVTEAKLAEHDANVLEMNHPASSRRLSVVQCKYAYKHIVIFITLCTHEIILKSNQVNSMRNEV